MLRLCISANAWPGRGRTAGSIGTSSRLAARCLYMSAALPVSTPHVPGYLGCRLWTQRRAEDVARTPRRRALQGHPV